MKIETRQPAYNNPEQKSDIPIYTSSNILDIYIIKKMIISDHVYIMMFHHSLVRVIRLEIIIASYITWMHVMLELL